jgi:polyisoprenoid-binding protein YceI
MRNSVPYLCLLTAAVGAHAAPVKYDIDPTHTQVIFRWNHFGFSKPSAMLEKIDGTFLLDTTDLAKSSIEVTLPLEGLHTGVPKLDEHLKSADFFDAAKFPNITFKSTHVTPHGTDRLEVIGDLTVHGVTRPVKLDVHVNKIGENPMLNLPSAGFDAKATLKRSEFGLGAYVPNVSDEIEVWITLDSHRAK